MENINKALKTATITVKVKKVFEPKLDNYGNNKMNSIVTYNGVDYYASFKENLFHLVKEGNEILGTRESYQGAFYYKWHEAEASEATKTFERATAEPVKDGYQEKVSRGASYNLAFQFCLKEFDMKLPDMLRQVEICAEQITKHQSSFVNKT
ncbi:MAG: hypothetical protein ABIH76_00745 [Candidatus Bathyarchaeota archaeon]